jgi:hypothetical protein
MPMTAYLFSYGTLQDEKVQIELFGRLLPGSGDVLKGYKVSTIEIRDESFLSKGEQPFHLIASRSKNGKDFIKGTALEIMEEELVLADEYEPENYKRIVVVLESGKKAWIYVSVET